jgi:hypothetical protein
MLDFKLCIFCYYKQSLNNKDPNAKVQSSGSKMEVRQPVWISPPLNIDESRKHSSRCKAVSSEFAMLSGTAESAQLLTIARRCVTSWTSGRQLTLEVRWTASIPLSARWPN